MKPVIGILYCAFEDNRQFVSSPYIEAVSLFGGLPVIIPCPGTSGLSKEDIIKYFRFCDGFLFCGGNDISPQLFGEELQTDKGTTDWKTDSFHIRFMKYVLSYKFPVLGICRGMQVLNTALGGTLYQDLSLRTQRSLNHMQRSMDRSDCCHNISVTEGSILHKICGDSISVNSFHHQCIKKTGDTLKISAVASDGIIEAVESTVFPFALGVQWHPECMIPYHKSMEQLFLVFIEISKKMKKNILL